MIQPSFNKFRAAVQVLQRGREQLVDEVADEILDRADDLYETPYQFNEFLENQGTRLHFLTMMVGMLEQSAEQLDERRAEVARLAKPAPTPKVPKARKPRVASKKLGEGQQANPQRKRNADEG